MTHAEGALLYEMQRVDLEFAVVNSIEKELRANGKIDEADDIREAADYLRKAVIMIRAAWKRLGITSFEQMKMDFFDDTDNLNPA